MPWLPAGRFVVGQPQDMQGLEDPAVVGDGLAEMGGIASREIMRVTSCAETSPRFIDTATRHMSSQ